MILHLVNILNQDQMVTWIASIMTAGAYSLWSNLKNGITVESINVATGAREQNTQALLSTWPSMEVHVLVLTSALATW